MAYNSEGKKGGYSTKIVMRYDPDTKPFYSRRAQRPKDICYPKYEFNKDKGCCFYCKSPFIFSSDRTKDHIFPRTKGGTLEAGNYVYCCVTCNGKKGNLTVIEWIDKIKNSKTHNEKYRKAVIETLEFMIEKLHGNKKPRQGTEYMY